MWLGPAGAAASPEGLALWRRGGWPGLGAGRLWWVTGHPGLPLTTHGSTVPGSDSCARPRAGRAPCWLASRRLGCTRPGRGRQAGRQAAGRCGPAKVPRRKSTEGTHHRPARRCGCGGNGMGRRAFGAGGKDRMLERGRAAGGGSGRKAVRASPLFTRPKSEGGPGVEGFPHAAVLRVAAGAGWSVGVGVGGRDEGRQAGRQENHQQQQPQAGEERWAAKDRRFFWRGCR